VGSELIDETSKNSFIYVESELLPAMIPESENVSTPLNWLMAVSGR